MQKPIVCPCKIIFDLKTWKGGGIDQLGEKG